MLGQMTELMVQARQREAAQLATEQEVLLESIGDPDLTLGLLWGSLSVKQETGQMADILRWSQLGIDIADGDPVKAYFHFGFAVGAGIGVSRLRASVAWSSGVAGGFRRCRRDGP